LRYFAEEYKAHVDEHRCPAGVCKDGGEDEFREAEIEAPGAADVTAGKEGKE
jgi:hypothetical protein